MGVGVGDIGLQQLCQVPLHFIRLSTHCCLQATQKTPTTDQKVPFNRQETTCTISTQFYIPRVFRFKCIPNFLYFMHACLKLNTHVSISRMQTLAHIGSLLLFCFDQMCNYALFSFLKIYRHCQHNRFCHKQSASSCTCQCS